jgi:hypothetical protein
VPQLVVVVEILVAKRDPKNPLTDKGRDLGDLSRWLRSAYM